MREHFHLLCATTPNDAFAQRESQQSSEQFYEVHTGMILHGRQAERGLYAQTVRDRGERSSLTEGFLRMQAMAPPQKIAAFSKNVAGISHTFLCMLLKLEK
jgi:hypothetical protein